MARVCEQRRARRGGCVTAQSGIEKRPLQNITLRSLNTQSHPEPLTKVENISWYTDGAMYSGIQKCEIAKAQKAYL